MKPESAVAILLLGAAAVFLVFLIFGFAAGRSMPDPAGPASPESKLRSFSEHRAAWQILLVGFFVTFLASGLALYLLGRALESRGGGLAGQAGGILYLLAVVAFLVYLALQFGGDLLAGRRWAETGVVPEDWVDHAERLSWLYQGTMTLMFVGLCLVGLALLQSGAVARGVAWTALGLGSLLVLSFATKFPSFGEFNPADLPLWVHVWGTIVGIGLLARSGAA